MGAAQTDEKAIESDPSVIFVLDQDLRIRLCNGAWDRFALENGGAHLLRRSILGRPIFDFISGNLADHYRKVFRQTLQRDIVWQQDYECSSPSVLRRFCMHVYPVRGELLIVNSLLVQSEHDREVSPAIEAHYRDSGGILLMCSNCRRVRAKGPEARWDWVPGFVLSPPARVSHGLCPPCYEYYSSKLD